jgi:hypothetical protein
LYSKCLTKEALDGLRDFKLGGQIIQTVKYADDLVLMAKEETVLQGKMEMNVEKTKVECGKNKSNENFKTTNPSHNKDRPKTTGECENF